MKLGQPRNKGLLRAMEDPEKRRAIDKTELSLLHRHTQGGELFALKEELFFTDRRARRTRPISASRAAHYMNPDDPDAFVLPDLITQFAEIDNDRRARRRGRSSRRKPKRQALHAITQSERIHNISQLLRAYCLFEKDVHYVVEEGKVVIVDEFTGRKMPGRRWSDGLHQARRGQGRRARSTARRRRSRRSRFRITSAFTTKLAGMTGTAETEANEFHDVYKLDVAVIPTNRPCIRKDMNDFIYKTRREKFNAVVKEIAAAHAQASSRCSSAR